MYYCIAAGFSCAVDEFAVYYYWGADCFFRTEFELLGAVDVVPLLLRRAGLLLPDVAAFLV